MSGKECPQCWATLPADARRCPTCGWKFETATRERKPPQMSNKKLLIGFATLLSFAFLFTIFTVAVARIMHDPKPRTVASAAPLTPMTPPARSAKSGQMEATADAVSDSDCVIVDAALADPANADSPSTRRMAARCFLHRQKANSPAVWRATLDKIDREEAGR